MSIICLTGGLLGTNTYIIPAAGKRCFVIDPSVSVSSIEKRIRDEGLELTSIVLTHGHYDHLESLLSLKHQFPNVSIVIHEDDAWALGKGALKIHEASFRENGLGDLYPEFNAPNGAIDLPIADTFVKDGDLFEKEWKIIQTPGHSPGSICLYNEVQKLLISGDTLFYMGWGRTDVSGGDEEKLMHSLKRLSLLPGDVKVFPGHGRYGFTMAQNPIM